METPQLPLFPEQGTPASSERSVDEIAEHIARNARPVEYVDRTSEAAHDQGWGQVIDITSVESSKRTEAEEAVVHAQKEDHPSVAGLASSRIYQAPGVEELPRRGRDNWHRPDPEPSSEDKRIAIDGFASARKALQQTGEN